MLPPNAILLKQARNVRKVGMSARTRFNGRLRIHEAVQDALQAGRPVVALESTIVAHGMSYPENLNLSRRVATILRAQGVEPATIAVKDGICRVGISVEELEDLAIAGQEGRAQKCSTRELSLLLAQQQMEYDSIMQGAVHEGTQWGATTVASTMKLAHLAGISTFVTGGIGGVHRDGQNSMDISADLTELGRTPVIVVSAGIKSILDIKRTLEVLETKCVPTIAYQTDEFPAFFSPFSGVPAPARMDNPAQIAAAFLAARDLDLPHGMLVAVPNSDPAGAEVEQAIQASLKEASQKGIRGQAVTPFLLKRVAELTGGDSLRSNMALVENNAAIGAQIALAIIEQQQMQQGKGTVYRAANISRKGKLPKVVVMGGAVLDIVARPKGGEKLIIKTSNPAVCTESDGGVGRNIAEVLGRLGSFPLMYSAVGDDSRGHALVDRMQSSSGVDLTKESIKFISGASTATYLAVLEGDGDLHTACADMDVLCEIPCPSREVLRNAEFLVVDANPSKETLKEAVTLACRVGAKVFFEPTSVPKAAVLAKDSTFLSSVTYSSPNLDELFAMADVPFQPGAKLETIQSIAETVLNRMSPAEAYLIVTMGSNGVLLAQKDAKADSISFQSFAAPTVEGHAHNATGAGDTLCGAFIHALLAGKSVEEAVKFGMKAALISLQCTDKTISPQLSGLTL